MSKEILKNIPSSLVRFKRNFGENYDAGFFAFFYQEFNFFIVATKYDEGHF
jgi:hypothetical protein